MKRALSVTAVLFALCLVLSGCSKVQHAEKLIEEIGEVTIDSGPQIEAAEQAIAELDAEQKAKIENLDLFEEAKREYAEALEIQKENDKKVKRVENRIENIKTVTIDSWNAISIARREYDALDSDLQESVSNKDKLFESEAAFERLAIQTVTDAIKQIGTVSLENEGAIISAKKAYEQIDESIQKKIENRETLFAAEDELIQLKVEHAQSAIDAIGSDITLESKDAIFEAAQAFNSVPVNDREKVENRAVLTKATETYDALVNEQKRQAEIEEARKLIRITKVAVSAPDSAGGVELYFNYINNSDKVIKYVNFSVTFYNAVGDIVKGKYNQSTVNYCYDTGPFKKGEGRTGTWWHWGDYYNWDITSVKLVDLSIEYTDGTTVIFTKDQVDGVQY